jgi:hypothetical protein
MIEFFVDGGATLAEFNGFTKQRWPLRPMVRKGSLWAFLVCARGCASGIVCRAVPYRGAIGAETSKHNAADQPPFFDDAGGAA